MAFGARQRSVASSSSKDPWSLFLKPSASSALGNHQGRGNKKNCLSFSPHSLRAASLYQEPIFAATTSKCYPASEPLILTTLLNDSIFAKVTSHSNQPSPAAAAAAATPGTQKKSLLHFYFPNSSDDHIRSGSAA